MYTCGSLPNPIRKLQVNTHPKEGLWSIGNHDWIQQNWDMVNDAHTLESTILIIMPFRRISSLRTYVFITCALPEWLYYIWAMDTSCTLTTCIFHYIIPFFIFCGTVSLNRLGIQEGSAPFRYQFILVWFSLTTNPLHIFTQCWTELGKWPAPTAFTLNRYTYINPSLVSLALCASPHSGSPYTVWSWSWLCSLTCRGEESSNMPKGDIYTEE